MTGKSVGRTPDYGSRRRPRDWQSNVGAVSSGLPLKVQEVDRARPKPGPVDRSHRPIPSGYPGGMPIIGP